MAKLQSPFTNGAILADEVGLGKTVEAGILFDGVFGASDEVLGALESGVDIERRIAEVYQTCRTNEEIARKLPTVELTLDYTHHPSKISILEPLVGQSGWLEVSKLTVEAVEIDEFLIFAAQTDHHKPLDQEICLKLMSLPAACGSQTTTEFDLSSLRHAEIEARLGDIETRNGQFFDEEVLKLDRWSEDLKLSLEHEIKELDKQVRDLRRAAALAQSLQDKLNHHKQIRELERRRNTKRRELYDAQDAIDQQREELIGKIEKQLQHKAEVTPLFGFQWRVV